MGSTKDHFSTVRQRVGKLPLYYREGLGIQHIDVEAVTRRLVSSAGQAYKIPAHAGYISVERIIVNFQKRHQTKAINNFISHLADPLDPSLYYCFTYYFALTLGWNVGTKNLLV